jgi:hypothetical protein
LFKFIKKSIIPIICIIAIKLLLAIFIQIQGIDISNNVYAFLIHNYSFETMAIGALGAYIIFITPPINDWKPRYYLVNL